MLVTIFIGKTIAIGVIRRININTLHLFTVFFLHQAQSLKIFRMNQYAVALRVQIGYFRQ